MRLQQQRAFMPLYMTLLAETEAEAGRPDAGLAIVDNRTGGDRADWTTLVSVGTSSRRRAEILLKCYPPGDTGAAELAFIGGINIARSQEAELFELQAAVGLGRLWIEEGKRAQARELLGPIYNWFTEGFDAPDLKDAKALLDELA